MKERPILFSEQMVHAILEDRKTQTRRTKGLEYFSSNDPDNWKHVRISSGTAYFVYKNCPVEREDSCPYGQPGDRMWVKEPWQAWTKFNNARPSEIPSESRVNYIFNGNLWDARRRNALHMPRWASRITLEITGVRVERLQNISEEDAKAEGALNINGEWAEGFTVLWESIKGFGSWDANPWVWVIEFKRITP